MKLEGKVDNIFSRQQTTKFGDKPVYSMSVMGTTIDLGFKKPQYAEGQFVKLDVEQNKWGKYEIVSANGAGGAPQSGAVQSASSQARRFPVSQDSYEIGIIRQNALTNAVKYHELHKGKPTIDEVLEVAYEFADFSSGNREVKAAKEMADD